MSCADKKRYQFPDQGNSTVLFIIRERKRCSVRAFWRMRWEADRRREGRRSDDAAMLLSNSKPLTESQVHHWPPDLMTVKRHVPWPFLSWWLVMGPANMPSVAKLRRHGLVAGNRLMYFLRPVIQHPPSLDCSISIKLRIHHSFAKCYKQSIDTLPI